MMTRKPQSAEAGFLLVTAQVAPEARIVLPLRRLLRCLHGRTSPGHGGVSMNEIRAPDRHLLSAASRRASIPPRLPDQ